MAGFRWTRVALLVLVCNGCRTTETAHVTPSAPPRTSIAAARPSDIGQETPSPTSTDDGIKLTSASTADGTGDAVAAAPGLSISETVSLALEQNPDLVALRQSENVSSAALGVAQTYPFNPFVQVQATPYQDAVSGGPGTTYHYVLLMQTIQLAHQQQFREEGAASLLNSTRWNIHQAELQNVAQTERLYFSVLYLRGLLDLATASHDNNQQLLRTLEKQLDAGQATAADVAIVRVDTRSTRQQVRLAKANYETALRDLRRQLGVAPDDSLTFAGKLGSFTWKAPHASPSDPVNPGMADLAMASDPGSVVVSWASARPDVMAAHSDIDAARAAMCLASASRTPDLQLGPYYQRTADGTTFLGFRAQMDVPVINNGRPLEQQRTAEFNQRVMVWQQLQRRAELEAKAAWERYELALQALAEDTPAENGSVPDELQALERQFLAGEVDVVRVMQARTSIIQSQRVHLDMLNELAQAAANLTGTSGLPLEQLAPTDLR